MTYKISVNTYPSLGKIYKLIFVHKIHHSPARMHYLTKKLCLTHLNAYSVPEKPDG